jgi:SnoaL-like domain
MSDERDVQPTLASYVRAADARDGVAVAEHFLPDGRIEFFSISRPCLRRRPSRPCPWLRRSQSAPPAPPPQISAAVLACPLMTQPPSGDSEMSTQVRFFNVSSPAHRPSARDFFLTFGAARDVLLRRRLCAMTFVIVEAIAPMLNAIETR